MARWPGARPTGLPSMASKSRKDWVSGASWAASRVGRLPPRSERHGSECWRAARGLDHHEVRLRHERKQSHAQVELGGDCLVYVWHRCPAGAGWFQGLPGSHVRELRSLVAKREPIPNESVSRQTAGKARPLVQADAEGMSSPGGGGHAGPGPCRIGPSPGVVDRSA